MRLAEDRIKAIQELPIPRTVKHLQQFLGAINYVRSFIAGYATLAYPLYGLLRKGTAFQFDENCVKSFEALKNALTKSPVLCIPDLSDKNQSYQVVIDSSKRGQGATLSQIINGERRIAAFWSRAVKKHQQKFGATRLEMLALHGAIKSWRLYLQGTKFEVLTDCKALLSLDKIFKNENSFFQRRLSDLSAFNFKVTHVSGTSSDIAFADFLSRYPYESSSLTTNSSTQTEHSTTAITYPRQTSSLTKDSCTQTENSDNISAVSKIDKILAISEAELSRHVSIEEIQTEYCNDSILTTVIEWLKNPSGPQRPSEFNHRSEPSELCHYWKNFSLLTLKDEILYRKWYDARLNETRELIVVPCTLVERTLYGYHCTLATGHAGVDACVEQCLQKLYFYKLKHEFKLYIKSCLQCARAKQPQAFLRAPLKRIEYSEFGQCISLDHLEPSKSPTPNGIVAILTICDSYSNYITCVPVRSVGTQASIKALLEHWCLRFGFPSVIQHDLGSGFESEFWKAVMIAFDIKDARTTPKYSQSNGKAESANRKINQIFRTTLTEKEWKNYDILIYLKYIVFCLNSLACTRIK